MDEYGNTLLNAAVQCNFYEGAEYLLKRGANINT
jgi:ankyrin repeat protein